MNNASLYWCLGALERVGTNGKVVHIYQTGNPQNAAVGSMNFSPEVSENLSTLNMYHLRSLEQGEDITAMHQNKPGAEGENSEIKRDTNGKVPFRY